GFRMAGILSYSVCLCGFFYRTWLIFDRDQRRVVKRWSAVVPLRQQVYVLSDFDAVLLERMPTYSHYTAGHEKVYDSEIYRVALDANGGPDLDIQIMMGASLTDAREVANSLALYLNMKL